jgi:hypothetical protein
VWLTRALATSAAGEIAVGHTLRAFVFFSIGGALLYNPVLHPAKLMA